MITFIITLITLLVVAATVLVFIVTGGLSFLLVFGDLIVCALIIMLIVRVFRRRR